MATIAAVRCDCQNVGLPEVPDGSSRNLTLATPYRRACRQSMWSSVAASSGKRSDEGVAPPRSSVTTSAAWASEGWYVGMRPPTTPVPRNVSNGAYRRPGRAGDEFRGLARVENPALAVLEIAGREDDCILSEPAQTVEDHARRKAGEIFDRDTPRNLRNFLLSRVSHSRSCPDGSVTMRKRRAFRCQARDCLMVPEKSYSIGTPTTSAGRAGSFGRSTGRRPCGRSGSLGRAAPGAAERTRTRPRRRLLSRSAA